MSINMYARQAPLHDVCGRADYISSSDRQEHLLATASTVSMPDFWQHLADDCQLAFRQNGGPRTKKVGEEIVDTRACEGREVHVQLPNSALKKMTAEQLAQKLANDFKSRYGVDCLVAIHYNGTESNLHFHLMFSERQALDEPEIRIADRNVFLDANGIRKRTKKEILDADGQLLPGCSIVKKGEILSARYFGEKDMSFSSKAWMDDYRHYMADWINTNLQPDKLRTVFDPNGPYFAQRKYGPGELDKKPGTKDWNGLVKMYNKLYDDGFVDPDRIQEIKDRVMLSPNQNQELAAVISEIMREKKPRMENRPNLDLVASQAASPSMTDKAENWEEKQKLRELYKERADLRSQIADMDPGMYRDLKKSELVHLNKRIEEQREKALGSKDLRMAQKIGRELGFTRKEVALIYDALPFFSEEEWARLWKNAAEGIKRYREKLEELARAQADYLVHLAEWRRYEKYRWVLDPRNHRSKSILGMLVAIVALSFMRSRGEILSDKEYAWAVKRGLNDDIRGKRRIDPVEEERLRLLGLKIQKAVDEIRAFREWEKNGRQGPRPGTEPLEEMDFADAAEQIESQWQWWENMHPDFMQAIAEQQAKDKPQSGNHDDHNDFDSL